MVPASKLACPVMIGVGERVFHKPGLILCLPHKLTNGITNRIWAQDDAIGGDPWADIIEPVIKWDKNKRPIRFVCPDVIELTQPRKMVNGAIAKTGRWNEKVRQCLTPQGARRMKSRYVLEIQYENSKPILLENGSVLTSIEPSIAGIYISTPAYDLPMCGCEARTTPSQMVRTASCGEVKKVWCNTKSDALSTTPSTQPRRVVWIPLKPNCATINWRWLVS
jgi:hypothetical protein